MAWSTAGVVVAVAAVGGLVVWRAVRVLRRRVAAEEARGLLVGAASHRDLDEFRRRLTEAMAELKLTEVEEAVVAEAERVVDEAWARHVVAQHRNDNEGGGL